MQPSAQLTRGAAPPAHVTTAPREAILIDLPGTGGTAAVVMIVVATLVRLLGAAFAIDPLAGPDTGSYLAAAQALGAHGFLAHHVPNLPYWPAGYPTFLAAVFAVTGEAPRAVAALQVLLLGGATWSLFALIRREIDVRPALIAVALMALSPALLAASDELMYETVLAAALVVSLDLASRATYTAAARRSLALATGAALLLGVASTMQPKALAVAPVLILWVLARRRDPRVLAAMLVAVALGPLALAARTDATAGHFTLSANFGATARIGLNARATGGYRYDAAVLRGCGLPARLVSRDRVGFSDADLFAFDRHLTRCSASWAAHHPLRFAALGADKAINFWTPMVGPLTTDRDATWAQPFDVRRAVPAATRSSSAFTTINRILGNLWMVLVVGLVAAGTIIGWHTRRAATVLLAAPVALFLLVSMVTIGDARFRLPVTPLYIALQAIALAALLDRYAAARARR